MKKLKILTLLFGAVLLSNEMYCDEEPVEKVFPKLPPEVKISNHKIVKDKSKKVFPKLPHEIKISNHIISLDGNVRAQNAINSTRIKVSYQGVVQTVTIKDWLVNSVGAFITKDWNFFNELKVDPNSGAQTESRKEGNIYIYAINFDKGLKTLWVCYDSITTNIVVMYQDTSIPLTANDVLVSKVDLTFKFESGVKFDYRNSKSYEELYSVKKNK